MNRVIELKTDSVLPLNDNTDFVTLQKIKCGDQQAFGSFYQRYYKPVFGFMLKVMRSREDAEDIVQEVFIRLWNMHEKIEPTQNIRALIFVMARRASIDFYRRSERSNTVSSDLTQEENISAGLSPEEILENNETKLLLEVSIAGMPKKQRKVFSMYYHDNLSPIEIAQKLGLTYDNVRKQIYNAKKHLKEVISIIFLFMLT